MCQIKSNVFISLKGEAMSHSIISTVLAYEGPGGGHADYNKAVEIISAYEENFAARRRKKAHDTTMVARPPFKRGSLGDAPMRTRGGGDAHPYPGTQEPCIYFLKRGRCFRGDRCHFRHIQPLLGQASLPTTGARTKASAALLHLRARVTNLRRLVFIVARRATLNENAGKGHVTAQGWR